MKIKLLFLIVLISSFIIAEAQQEVILTKYTYNSMFFNPAYAGSHGFGEGTANIHYRNQWIGFEGAPTTIMAGGEASLFENRVGLGLNFSRESIGVMSNTDVFASFAYRVQLNEGFLAGGIRAGFTNFGHQFDKLKIKDGGDVFDETSYNISAFTIGSGIYYNNNGMYLGLAIPTLARIISSKEGIGDRTRHVYMHGGILIGDEYSTIKFEPSILLKYEKAVPLQYTVGLNVWLIDDLAVGGHYRSTDALALSFELHFLKDYRIALAYDFTLSDIKRYSNGSLELLLGYRYNTRPNDPRVKSLRHGGRF